jgi:hypothetical protein
MQRLGRLDHAGGILLNVNKGKRTSEETAGKRERHRIEPGTDP